MMSLKCNWDLQIRCQNTVIKSKVEEKYKNSFDAWNWYGFMMQNIQKSNCQLVKYRHQSIKGDKEANAER